MMPLDATEISAAVADLKKRWPDFQHDLDRAKAVKKLKESGISIRELSRRLGPCESLLRRLLSLLRVPPLLQAQARRKNLSTNKAIRLHKESEARFAALNAARKRRLLDNERAKTAQKGCAAISDWLEERKLLPAHGEAVVEEARRILIDGELNRTLPKHTAPKGTSIKEIIQKSQPQRSDEETDVGWYAEWLALWAFHALPDSEVRDRALNLALDKEIRGDRKLQKRPKT